MPDSSESTVPEGSDWQARYLPPGRDARSHVGHLQEVLRAVDTYLPQQVVRARMANPQSPAVSGEFLEATLLFADISGFTAMSERLTQLGREGAEVITGIVNDYFATMLGIIARFGGDLFKFGGDALLVCFSGDDGAARGCQASLEMQQAMARFKVIETSQGAFGLRMTASLSSGTIFVASLGSVDRLEFAVTGPAVEQLARVDALAQPGQALVDEATYQAAGPGTNASERAPGIYHLQSTTPTPMASSPQPTADHPDDAGWLVERLDALTPYLTPELLKRIVASPGRRMFEGEHRQVTVLFANFYGINSIIEALGSDRADELTLILNQHFTAMRGVINKYGGVINKVDTYAVGYRIMVLFGAPIAHEDDPERAVLAALEMQEAMSAFDDLSTSGGRFSLKQRIGINTGYVFAGNLGSTLRQEYSVMGDEVNLTARLMGIAAEGQVLVSESTARAVEGCVDLQAHDLVKVKGKEQPVRSYRILSSANDQGAWLARRGGFFGRAEEMAQARARVDQALAGEGSVLDITGDPGVGKTRLIAELWAYAAERGMSILQGEAVSYGRNLPYLPWLGILNTLLGAGTSEDECQDTRRTRLAATLEGAGLADWAPVVGAVLGIEIPETPLTLSLDAQLRQQRFFDVVLQIVQRRAERSPLMVVLDDMQWADAISLDLIAYVARNVAASRLVLIVARRPDLDSVPWCGEACTPLPLYDLDVSSSLALARASLGGGELSPPLQRLILDRAQGNPLFVEEITRALSESGLIRQEVDREQEVWSIAAEAEDAQVPTTLTGLIMSRIDRLEATNRQLVQVAAVIGTAFSLPVLARVYPYGDLHANLRSALDSRLADLVQRDLMWFNPPDEYAFRHTLTREVAYESLSFARRRELHVRVGEDIEAAYVDLTEQFGILARHFERGHVFDKAFVYLVKAGERAQVEFANEAALADYRRALEIATEYAPPVPDLEAQGLDVLEAMGDIYLLTSLYGEAIEQFQLAAGQPACARRRKGDLLRKVAKAHELQGLYDEALQYLDQGRAALSEEEQDQHSAEMARIRSLSGWVLMRRGEVEPAIKECEQGLTIVAQLPRETATLSIEADLYNTLGTIDADLRSNFAEAAIAYQRSTELRQEAGDLTELARSFNNLARTAWAQGDLAGAGNYLQQMMEISLQIGNNYAAAFGYNNMGVVAYTTGNVQEALGHYQEALSLRQRIGDAYGVAQTCENLGEAYLSLEQYDEARRYLEQAIEGFESLQSERELPEAYCLLAQAELARGAVSSALDYAGRAQEIAATMGNAELQGIARRVQGSAQARTGAMGQARRSFESSIELLAESGHQIELARSHYEYGVVLAELPDQQQAARQHLSQASELFEAAGAEKEAAQARQELGQT